MDPKQVKISVVMPVYNEAATVTQVLGRVLDCGFDCEVIAVDDASTDGTRAILRDYRDSRARCFFHSVNRGQAAALRLAFSPPPKPTLATPHPYPQPDPPDH